MDPPTYESSSASSLAGSDSEAAPTSARLSKSHEPPPALLNLVPGPPEVSFQRGLLGYTAASVKGSLQIKFTSSDPAVYRSRVDRVTVEFAGVEQIKGQSADDEDDDKEQSTSGKASTLSNLQAPVDLIRESKVLWEKSAISPSSSSHATGSSSSGPPANLDFAFQLTDDLPHCCHVGSGSLQYTLKATLHSSTARTISVETPIHLTRTTSPNSVSSYSPSDAQPINSPEIYTSEHPTRISVFFPHGTSNIRRSEAIEFRVRIPPPEAALVQDKGLKLRNISAELVRLVSLREPEVDDGEIVELLDRPALRTVISRSGKAAAFSSTRNVFLHIWLQPVNVDACECITQSTIYNEVKFLIKVSASFRGKQGDRQDVTFFKRPITIIPDYPPNSHIPPPSPATPIAMPASSSSRGAGPSQVLDAELLRSFETETEYDGYEQMSEGATVENAPPNIDADQPPPSIEDAGSQIDGQDLLPTSDLPQPVEISQTPEPSVTPSDMMDEAPPYTSATEALPEVAVDTEHTTSQRRPEHHDHHDESPVPPPPYERQNEQAEQLPLEDPETMQQIRNAMHDMLRV